MSNTSHIPRDNIKTLEAPRLKKIGKDIGRVDGSCSKVNIGLKALHQEKSSPIRDIGLCGNLDKSQLKNISGNRFGVVERNFKTVYTVKDMLMMRDIELQLPSTLESGVARVPDKVRRRSMS
jgi:hypothetical protein